MKGLIIGDFSGLGKELRKGFLKNGIKVDLITSGDYWKNIKSGSIDLDYSFSNFLEKIYKGIKNRVFLKNFLKNNCEVYDFILIMNSSFINIRTIRKFFKLTFTLKEIKRLSKNKKNIYLIAAGVDEYYLKNIKFFEKKFNYFSLSQDEIEKSRKLYSYSENKIQSIFNTIDGIVPIMYEYYICYKNFNVTKLKNIIPICLDIEKISYKNEICKKIKILHGISRKEEKGSFYILEAMRKVAKKYPEKVEILIVERLGIKEYLKIMKETNILIDQCKSYGYGMNALYGMAMGKLVFSGNELENQKKFGEMDIPIVNITPDIKKIEEILEYYILNPDLIITEGKRARKFVERFHDSKVVAKQYLKLFEEESTRNEK